MRAVHIPLSTIPSGQVGHTEGKPDAVVHALSELPSSWPRFELHLLALHKHEARSVARACRPRCMIVHDGSWITPPWILTRADSPQLARRPVLRGMSREFLGAPGVRPWPVWAGGLFHVPGPTLPAVLSGGDPSGVEPRQRLGSPAERRLADGGGRQRLDRPEPVRPRARRDQCGVRRDAAAFDAERLGPDLVGGGQRSRQPVRRLGGDRVTSRVVTIVRSWLRRSRCTSYAADSAERRGASAAPRPGHPGRRTRRARRARPPASVGARRPSRSCSRRIPEDGLHPDARGDGGEDPREVAVLAGDRPAREPLGRPTLAGHRLGRSQRPAALRGRRRIAVERGQLHAVGDNQGTGAGGRREPAHQAGSSARAASTMCWPGSGGGSAAGVEDDPGSRSQPPRRPAPTTPVHPPRRSSARRDRGEPDTPATLSPGVATGFREPAAARSVRW